VIQNNDPVGGDRQEESEACIQKTDAMVLYVVDVPADRPVLPPPAPPLLEDVLNEFCKVLLRDWQHTREIELKAIYPASEGMISGSAPSQIKSGKLGVGIRVLDGFARLYGMTPAEFVEYAYAWHKNRLITLPPPRLSAEQLAELATQVAARVAKGKSLKDSPRSTSKEESRDADLGSRKRTKPRQRR
jgi:hypothetical protein